MNIAANANAQLSEYDFIVVADTSGSMAEAAKAVMLEPVRIRDLKMVVVTVASF